MICFSSAREVKKKKVEITKLIHPRFEDLVSLHKSLSFGLLVIDRCPLLYAILIDNSLYETPYFGSSIMLRIGIEFLGVGDGVIVPRWQPSLIQPPLHALPEFHQVGYETAAE